MDEAWTFDGEVRVGRWRCIARRGGGPRRVWLDLSRPDQARAVEALLDGRLAPTGGIDGSEVEVESGANPRQRQAWLQGDQLARSALLDGLAKDRPPQEAAQAAARLAEVRDERAVAVAAAFLALAARLHPECVQSVVDCILAERTGVAKPQEARVARHVAAKLGLLRVPTGLEESAAKAWLAERTSSQHSKEIY